MRLSKAPSHRKLLRLGFRCLVKYVRQDEIEPRRGLEGCLAVTCQYPRGVFYPSHDQ